METIKQLKNEIKKLQQEQKEKAEIAKLEKEIKELRNQSSIFYLNEGQKEFIRIGLRQLGIAVGSLFVALAILIKCIPEPKDLPQY